MREEVDAGRVGEGEGDEAVVGRHQGRQQPVEDAPQLLTWQKGKISGTCTNCMSGAIHKRRPHVGGRGVQELVKFADKQC